MGRWVTSKGRRIYIPDEGEENPFAKNKTGVTRKDVEELTSKRDKVKNANLKTTSITNEEIVQNKKDWDKLKNQINKDFDLKEKQIADNKKQTQFGADMNTKISDYQNKFLKKKSDKELDEIESNLKKSTSLVGTSVNDQVAFAAIENERKSRSGKKETTEQAMTRLQREAKARVESMSAAQILKYAKDNGLRGKKTDTLAQRDDRVATHMYMQEMKKWRKSQSATDRGKKK